MLVITLKEGANSERKKLKESARLLHLSGRRKGRHGKVENGEEENEEMLWKE